MPAAHSSLTPRNQMAFPNDSIDSVTHNSGYLIFGADLHLCVSTSFYLQVTHRSQWPSGRLREYHSAFIHTFSNAILSTGRGDSPMHISLGRLGQNQQTL